jgi:hypothetical protein
MADSPVAPPPPNAASEAKNSSQAGLLAMTARYATSQLAALTAFFGAIVAAYLSFEKLRKNVGNDLGLSKGECAALVIALLALLFFFHTLPTLLEKRRKAMLAEITGSTKPGYFQLAPREDEATFHRADGKHEDVLKWLRHPPRRVLYLTGSSGTGKSSLLAAWALPKLESEGIRVIRLRGYQDPAQALEEELKRPGVIWKRNPPETTNLSALFEEAHQHVQPARILVVFDQFEEFLILQEEQQRTRFVEFLTTQAGLKDTGSTILLVFRAEYDGFIQDLNLPVPMYGQNLQKVSAFTQIAARDFLVGSGLNIQDQLLADVLREAAKAEETKGLIRPVTLNLCGLVLSRFATGLPRTFRPGRLIHGFVYEAIFQKEVREATPILLPKLISHQATKQPCTIDDLTNDTSFAPRQVRGVMFKLGDPERGIVHALDPEYNIWEISHDFLVPMIDSILARWRVSTWRRVRPWLPLVYAAALLAMLFVAPRLLTDPIHELARIGWNTRNIDALNPEDADLVQDGIKYIFTFKSTLTPESVHALKRIPLPFAVKLTDISSFDSAHFDNWSGLTNLRRLDLSGASKGFSDISALTNMSHLTSVVFPYNFQATDAELKLLPRSLTRLILTGDTRITDAGLKDLPRSLTWLDLLGDDKITDAGIKDLPQSLTSLDLSGDAQITDAGIKDLPRSLTMLRLHGDDKITDAGLAGLKDRLISLTSLDLHDDARITDAGLKDLPRSLTWLILKDDDNITDAGLKDLPRSLTLLDLGDNNKITDAGLRDLPRSLTSLNLGYDHQITDTGLKHLPSSLTTLSLSNDDKITDAGLRNLPSSLISLNLSMNDRITDAGLKNLPSSLTSLNLDGNNKITNAGLRNLPVTTHASCPHCPER